MDIIKDFDKFTMMAKGLMKANMTNAKNTKVFDGTEEHLAAMVARAHNGGNWKRPLSDLSSPSVLKDQNHYVKYFLGKIPGKGDWYSLRCADSFGEETVKLGSQGKGVGGLEMQSLKLN